ncbi:MAG TPA: phosphoribosylamine--glycine ligase [Actinomycetota bacterium]
MKVLVVGKGAREHALAWRIAQDPGVDKIFAVPGNPGIATIAECLPDDAGAADLAEELGVDLVVVGPEAPLVAGLADELRARDVATFGPSAAAARIEGSKAWAKEILAKANAPTARALSFADPAEAKAALDEFEPPYVIKADGLAAGKGVVVAPSRSRAEEAIDACLVEGRFGEAGASLLIEEFLDGEELSVFCVTDGQTVVPLAAAQDYKRVFDGDEGPNTGGMGAYSPVPHLPPDTVARAVREIFEPVIAAMRREDVPYQGVLYGGLMVTASGPKVFEFNCRFGDPEAQVVLPRIGGSFAGLLMSCARGSLASVVPSWRPEACVTVVLASGGYPGAYDTGMPITGIAEAESIEGVTVFHAGTKGRDPLRTDGGRVLSVSALGADLGEARARAYDAAGLIRFEGKHMRTDIAARAVERSEA